MQANRPILLGLALLMAVSNLSGAAPEAELAQLHEMLHDRQNPRVQSQAALLLLQAPGPMAEQMVRQGLKETEDVDTFLALASAVRLGLDNRFLEELLAALSANRPVVRQAAAESLAPLTDARLVTRLKAIVEDGQLDPVVRQAALWTLGRCGRRLAVAILLEQLKVGAEPLRATAVEALVEMAGQDLGTDPLAWQAWWDRHKDLPAERWLEQRLAYQASRARRLDGDLERARSQVVRLHQQLYSRLAAGERVPYLRTLLDQDDPAVRVLAVNWILELQSAMDGGQRQALPPMLLRLSQDGALEVQRAAVLALGRIQDPAGWQRLLVLLQQGQPAVRAAAARSLTALARGTDAEAQERQKLAVLALQKALNDPALEVVVEVAEDLGILGAPGAGPVLIGLLQHPSEHVRQTAAQALERVADASVVESLLKALSDPSLTVRFSLVGALQRALAEGKSLPEAQKKRVLARLETLLQRDADPSVRSRAATVLGECAPPGVLGLLWECVLAGEDGRVQEKAWGAFVEIIARASNLTLLRDWDRTLTSARQGPRRLQLLGDIATRWQQQPESRLLATAAQEALVQAQLELGKGSAAFPVVRDLLTRASTEGELKQRLRWLLAVGDLALREGNRTEALRVVQEAQAYVPKSGELADGFQHLARQASAP